MKDQTTITMTRPGGKSVTGTMADFRKVPAMIKAKMSKQDPLTVKLFNLYGCNGCKGKIDDDVFLLEHMRFWCNKQKRSFGDLDNPHNDCPTWQFNGNEKLLKDVEKGPDLPFAEDAK